MTKAPVHVEPAPLRREAMTPSGARRGAGRGGGEVRPGHGDGVVNVQDATVACARRVLWGAVAPRHIALAITTSSTTELKVVITTMITHFLENDHTFLVFGDWCTSVQK